MRLTVLKRSGAAEPFTREKAVSGVRRAGPAGVEDDLACLGEQVEDTLRAEGWAEVPAHEVGLAILGQLRELEEVAYLRFASVYRAFESRTTSRPRSRCSAPSVTPAPRPSRAAPRRPRSG